MARQLSELEGKGGLDNNLFAKIYAMQPLSGDGQPMIPDGRKDDRPER